MSQKKIKKVNNKPPQVKLSAQMLMHAVAQMKRVNEDLITSVDDKLGDFHKKLNDINYRLEVIEKALGIEYEGVTNDNVGGSEGDSPSGGTE